jgi:hypothetical protein
MTTWLVRLTCFFFGHGPYHEGYIGMQKGKFCIACDLFIPTLPAPKAHG